MTGLPEQPNTTVRARFFQSNANGVFDFYRQAFLSGPPGIFEVNYQADGLDNYFRLAALRSGDLLVVSFPDTGDHPHTAVEHAPLFLARRPHREAFAC